MSTESYIPEICDELGITDYSKIQNSSRVLFEFISEIPDIQNIEQLSKLLNLEEQDFLTFINSDWNNFWPKTSQWISTKIDLLLFLLKSSEKKFQWHKHAVIYLLGSYFIETDTDRSKQEFASAVLTEYSQELDKERKESYDSFKNELSNPSLDGTITARSMLQLVTDHVYSNSRAIRLLRFYQDSVRDARELIN